MNLTDLARLVLTAVLLGGGSAFTTELMVQDKITEPLRNLYWRAFPYPGMWLPAELDGGIGGPAPEEGLRAKLGYIMTCPYCFGVWSMAGWAACWWAWPTMTLRFAMLGAGVTLQRLVNTGRHS